MKLMNRLERWLYRFRLQPFFRYIIFTMAGLYAIELFVPRASLYGKLMLYMPLVYQGQLWRLLTFLVLPPLGNPMSVLLHLYFYYFIGTSLEARWGVRRFLMYFIVGAVGALLAALITQMGTNQYLYLSMFFAFAILHPEMQILLFFVLPIKVKWLGLLSAVFYVYSFIMEQWPGRLALLFSLLNVFLFFGGDLINLIRSEVQRYRQRQRFRNANK